MIPVTLTFYVAAQQELKTHLETKICTDYQK